MTGKRKTTNNRSNAGDKDPNSTPREPPDPPDPPDKATRSRTRAKKEGADENTAQTDDTRSTSAERKTTSEVGETPERQASLREDTPAEDLAPITRNIDKGKGRQIAPSSEEDHDPLLSPQRYEIPRTSAADNLFSVRSLPTSARYSSTLASPIEIEENPGWVKTMTSELGKIIVTMGRETQRRDERHREEMRDILKDISEQADRREERHQNELRDILRMFSEENGKRERRFYSDLLTQQGRATAEINAANNANAVFLRELQQATLGAIATTVQQRQGINVQGDTSHTTQTPDPQEEVHETTTPAEEQQETPTEQEPVEEIIREEEPTAEEQMPREYQRQYRGNPRPRGRNGERRGGRPTGPPPMPPRQPPRQPPPRHPAYREPPPRHPARREQPPPPPPESPPGSDEDQSPSEVDDADDERGGGPGHERPGRRRRGTRAESPYEERRGPADASPGYDFRNLDRAGWGERASRSRTPGEAAAQDRHSQFHRRIHDGIERAVQSVVDHEAPPAGGYIALKTVAAATPIPTYEGNDDLEIFMKWLQAFLNYLDVHQLVGETYDHHRVITMRAAMRGPAQAWFDTTIRRGAPNNTEDRITFIQAIFRMADAFISPAAATRAQQRFDQITYARRKGILSYVRELQMVSYHVLLPVDEYTLRKQIIQAIPSSIRNMLIDYKGLSVSTSSVAEWVDAIEKRERELLEKEAYEETQIGARRNTSAPNWKTQVRFNTNQTRGRAPERPKTGERNAQSGNKTSTGRKVPLDEIKCHACGNKGHYKGSKECPKTPTSKRLHAISVDTEDEDNGPEETEEPFEGEDYEGEPDQEFDEASEDGEEYESYGVAVASIHVESDSEDEDLEETTATIAAMAASNIKDEETLAAEIVNSVKEDYELRGSGQKPKPRGPTIKQLKAEAQKSQAIISNVDGTRPEGHKNKPRNQPPLDVSGMTAYIKINGVEALACWDSASQLDCISPDFIRAIGLTPQTKAEPVKIRLGLKGSSSRCSYEVTPTIELGEKKIEDFTLSVANIYKWDVILGNGFLNQYKMHLDYENKQLWSGKIKIPILAEDEVERILKRKKKATLAAMSK
jgi:hypothetical protein